MWLALLLAGQAAAPPPPAPPSDVVVRALRKLRLATDIEDGKVASCQVRVSSGDAGIDKTACEATSACVAAGFTESEPLANCVDRRLDQYVRSRRAAEDAEDKGE